MKILETLQTIREAEKAAAVNTRLAKLLTHKLACALGEGRHLCGNLLLRISYFEIQNEWCLETEELVQLEHVLLGEHVIEETEGGES